MNRFNMGEISRSEITDWIAKCSDDDLIQAILEIKAEARYRTGRCDICGQFHSTFNNCPDPMRLRTVIERPSGFEAKLAAALS
ncbi:hypothetical protein [Cypionkella sp.]|uniref:hypothetical protein n=1 Tax=Cypionkella sp. TaxID=2811411 RepID=UPI002ABA03E1|nr:hypothetical protein [Cypionkella sp.]MDZ4394458.1 hypothetical protein [Cypionkella sp.]